MVNKDYIETNNRITIESMKNRKKPEYIKPVLQRYQNEFDMLSGFISPEDLILDLGCKDGIWLDLLKENGFNNLIGVDCCAEAIAIVKNKKYKAYEADIQNLIGFNDEYFDAITCIHTLEHVPEPEKVKNECFRLLKQNGIVFIEIPTQKFEPATDWGHFHIFTDRKEVIDLFEPEFELLEIVSMDPPSKKPWHRFIFVKK